VSNENGRLMIQPPGAGPERLLKQENGSFSRRHPQSLVFHLSCKMNA
jgi:hypothetical protein